MRIPLPPVQNDDPNPQAHPFPIQVALQTQEFMQASIYHTAFMDIAVGQRIRQPNGIAGVEKELFDGGLDSETNNQAWAILGKYQDVFSRFVYQNVLILLRSHWDWYIEKIGAFVIQGRSEVGGPALSNKAQKALEQVGFAAIRKQIEILEDSIGITFQFGASVLDDAEEMSLVRNLGIHNRWEVNDFYLTKTQSVGAWSNGELRLFDATEVEKWHKSLINMTHQTSIPIAKHYRTSSAYST